MPLPTKCRSSTPGSCRVHGNVFGMFSFHGLFIRSTVYRGWGCLGRGFRVWVYSCWFYGVQASGGLAFRGRGAVLEGSGV